MLFIFLGFYTIETEKRFEDQLSDAAISITNDEVDYDASYFTIKYPNGDIPENKGVCTDVVIRSYRKFTTHRDCHQQKICRWQKVFARS
ncbi:DUF1287 domain-containing protein [Flavobacterium sp. 3HN19-14]|uniref:DUF1287 domain-containing protein n=1 Tax=Flavobacterium sp. 3HN19-14 TaxID=3448133 RepID=UPI003EE0D044